MALQSGSFDSVKAKNQNGNSGNNNYITVSWEETSTDATNNRSAMKVSVIYHNPYSTWNHFTYPSSSEGARLYLKVNGTNQFSNPTYRTITWDNTDDPVTIVSNFTFNVNHDDDGTKTITLNAQFISEINSNGHPDGSSNDGEFNVSQSITLTTIPRVSTISDISNFNIEDGVTVTVTKKNSDFTDNLTVKIGSTTIKTINSYTTQKITFTGAEIVTAYKAITASATSGTFTFTITTKNGSTTVGTASKTATGNIIGTMKLKVSGTWKHAVPWVNVNGTWKRAVGWTRVSGTWKKGEY